LCTVGVNTTDNFEVVVTVGLLVGTFFGISYLGRKALNYWWPKAQATAPAVAQEAQATAPAVAQEAQVAQVAQVDLPTAPAVAQEAQVEVAQEAQVEVAREAPQPYEESMNVIYQFFDPADIDPVIERYLHATSTKIETAHAAIVHQIADLCSQFYTVRQKNNTFVPLKEMLIDTFQTISYDGTDFCVPYFVNLSLLTRARFKDALMDIFADTTNVMARTLSELQGASNATTIEWYLAWMEQANQICGLFS